MAKDKFERNKMHLNIGTIGHIDHGKTTLTAAITKTLARNGLADFTPFDRIDKAPEAKASAVLSQNASMNSRCRKMLENQRNDQPLGGNTVCDVALNAVKTVMISGIVIRSSGIK